jgi:hypothetical protein
MRRAVARRGENGAGPDSFRLGRRVLYRLDDLHDWIDAQHDHGSAGRS